jgi:plasmid stabilization system protein ParE
MKVRYTETALVEIDGIFSCLADRDSGVAAQVVARFEQLVSRLAEFPLLGYVVNEAGVRILPLGRYPYLVFYTSQAEEVVILHVRHAARLRP